MVCNRMKRIWMNFVDTEGTGTFVGTLLFREYIRLKILSPQSYSLNPGYCSHSVTFVYMMPIIDC